MAKYSETKKKIKTEMYIFIFRTNPKFCLNIESKMCLNVKILKSKTFHDIFEDTSQIHTYIYT